MYNVLEWSCFIGWWLGVIIPMKRVVECFDRFFLFDITFFFSQLYIIKKNCRSPNNPTISNTLQKKLPMDYNNVNRWYNIGIKTYMDYMGTFQSYPRITDYQDTSTHERVTRVHT